MLYSYKGETPAELPQRIRMLDGSTRTDSITFTAQELSEAGYVLTSEAPAVSLKQKTYWTGTAWQVLDLTQEELTARDRTQWAQVRQTRNNLISDVEWRIQRHMSEVRLGKRPTDDISKLDQYIQELRDVTLQADPFNVTWPQTTEFINIA